MLATQQRRKLDVQLDRAAIQQILHIGQQRDMEKGSLYDARSGCVNIWCSPEDKPACWDEKIKAGALPFPRSYVGALDWEWSDGEVETAELFAEAAPYDLLDGQEGAALPAAVWEELLRWTEAKARELIALTLAAPQIIGTHCPFCAYVLRDGQLLNKLVEHIAAAHPQQRVESVVIGGETAFVTAQDAYPLLNAEEVG